MKFFRTLESAELDRSARTATQTRELGRRELAPRRWQPEQDRNVVEDSLGFLLRRVAGNSVEALGDLGTIRRYYTVDTLPIPLDNLRKITVEAYWLSLGDTMRVRSTTYVRR